MLISDKMYVICIMVKPTTVALFSFSLPVIPFMKNMITDMKNIIKIVVINFTSIQMAPFCFGEYLGDLVLLNILFDIYPLGALYVTRPTIRKRDVLRSVKSIFPFFPVFIGFLAVMRLLSICFLLFNLHNISCIRS